MSAKDAERLRSLNVLTAERRSRFWTMLGFARDAARPARLAEQVGNRVLDWGLESAGKAKNAIRANPGKAIGAAVAVGAILARRPLFSWIAKGFEAGRDYVRRTTHEENAGNGESNSEE